MIADPHIPSFAASKEERAEAIYFRSGDNTLFGWLHTPAERSMTDIGVVICKPFGYEAICSHRSVRAFADAVAAIGTPALRFDYLGTGDSGEIDPRADQLEFWCRDVAAAVGELQRRTGVSRVCLLGFRLGALVASLTASQCKSVSSLILVAPVVSGRRYVRQLRTTQLAASMMDNHAESAGSAPDNAQGTGPDSMEISGFSLSAATVAALTQIDLTKRAAPPVSDMLVIDSSSLPGAKEWAGALSGLGIRTQYRALPGLIEMTMTAPQFAAVPEAMIAATREWLLQFPPAHTPRPAGEGHGLDVDFPPITQLTFRDGDSSQHARLTERAVIFESEASLFGIVTEPADGEIRRRAVILLNAGADYHIGASGMYVALARCWSRLGYFVLRMDLAGLGDSGRRSERADNEVFPPAAVDDIRAAVEFMRGRYNVHDFTLAGLCSGAYHALRAAVAGVPATRIFMINPQNFFWKDGMTVNDMQVMELVDNGRAYGEWLTSASAWKKLLSGRVDIRYVMKRSVHRLLLLMESMLRDLARQLHVHLPRDLGRELEQIARRGVQIVFVFARGEPGLELLKMQGGSSVRRLGARCRVHIIDGADHVFSKSGPREVMRGILTDELSARVQLDSPGGAEVPIRRESASRPRA